MKGEKHGAIIIRMLTIVCGLLLLLSSGCGDGGNDAKRHLNEQDFAKDPSLVATPHDVVIINLEAETAGLNVNDTYLPGIDRIPIRFPADVSHTFVLEQKEETDAFFALLLDNKGNEILRLDRAVNEVTQNIAAGKYTIELHHGGGIDSDYTLFARPGGTYSTYIGGGCPGCDLSGMNMTGANLIGANLSGAYMIGTDLTGANLTAAILAAVDLSSANLSVANMTGAILAGANFNHAFLIDANLTDANLNIAYLGFANLTGAILIGADLSGATWTDGITKCSDNSIGTCL